MKERVKEKESQKLLFSLHTFTLGQGRDGSNPNKQSNFLALLRKLNRVNASKIVKKNCITVPSDSASASVSAISAHRCAERFCIGLDVGKHSVVLHFDNGQKSLCSEAHVQTGQRTWPAITTALSLPFFYFPSHQLPSH